MAIVNPYYLSISNQVELSAGATPKLAAADEGTKPLCAILFDLFIRIVHIKWLYFLLHYSNLIIVYLLHNNFVFLIQGTPTFPLTARMILSDFNLTQSV